jgi:hypothetical protein
LAERLLGLAPDDGAEQARRAREFGTALQLSKEFMKRQWIIEGGVD